MKKSSGYKKSNRGGFSLVEVLLVIGVVIVLSALVGVPLISLLRSGNTNLAADQVSGMVEHARTTAMQMNTWVWIGLADTTAQNRGEEQLSLVEVVSRDGSSELRADNLMQLRPSIQIRHVKNFVDPDPRIFVLGSEPGEFAFDWNLHTARGSEKVTFSSSVIAFSPRGDALVTTDAKPEWIKIAVGASSNPAGAISVMVAGSTGQVVVAR